MPQVNFVVMGQVLLFVIILLLGNISWKMGLVKMNGFMVGSKTPLESVLALLYSPWMWLGGVFYIIGTLWWFYVMSKENLSYIYPMVSIGYILTAIAGIVIFKETVSATGWIGMFIVMVGFVVLSMKAT
jgi:undecaprenyl phosphate-alpha-L-ara4N flippase subunit ArnF